MHGVASAVISHWSVSGIQHYQGGQPISIFGATGIPGKNSSVRFNRVAGQPVKNKNYTNPLNVNSTSNATACATGYFNCAAFYDPNLFTNRDPNGVGVSGEGNPWRFGTMPRNSADIRWSGYNDEDFGISKVFPINERIKVDFRGDMSTPSTAISSPGRYPTSIPAPPTSARSAACNSGQEMCSSS